MAEDDLSIQRLIAATLRRRRFLIDVASNGQEAIEKLARNDYAMLTLDLMMPYVTGWDVIEWLKAHPERKPVSVTVISAAAEDVFRRLDATTVNAVFIKPFDLDVLGKYISATLRRPTDRRKARFVRNRI